MIEINLLPKELRKRRRVRKKRTVTEAAAPIRIPAVPVAVAVIFILVAAYVSLSLMISNNKKLSKTLAARWEAMEPQREKVKEITLEIDRLEKKAAAIREIARPDIDWAKLMEGLNQAIISNVWLSSFKLEFRTRARGKKAKVARGLPVSLGITGYALGKSEEATSRVAKFIASLRKNRYFSGYFDDIELDDLRNEEVAKKEAMRFKLECRFKRVGAVSVDGGRTEKEGKKG